MGLDGVSESQVSRLCAEIEERVLLRRPIEGDWPYPWLDATYESARACWSNPMNGPPGAPAPCRWKPPAP
jgi:transposase-like protein